MNKSLYSRFKAKIEHIQNQSVPFNELSFWWIASGVCMFALYLFVGIILLLVLCTSRETVLLWQPWIANIILSIATVVGAFVIIAIIKEGVP